MTEDFYCDEVLSGKTSVNKVMETKNMLAYYHTRPFYPVHIVKFNPMRSNVADYIERQIKRRKNERL